MRFNKNFLSGMGSIMGSFNPTFFYTGAIGEYYRIDAHNDLSKIRNDFIAVGRDMRIAMHKYENSTEVKQGKQLELF